MKTCLYCDATVASNRRTCGSAECVGADSSAWLSTRRAAHTARLAERAATMQPRALLGRARRAAIFERDAWTCHICSTPIDQGANWPHPMSPVIDHVQPLALGGSNDEGNLAAAHAHCNNVKSDRESVCAS